MHGSVDSLSFIMHWLTHTLAHTTPLLSPTVSALYWCVYTGTSFREISSSWMGSLDKQSVRLLSLAQVLSLYQLKIFVVTSLLRNAQRTYLIIMHLIDLTLSHALMNFPHITSVFVAISNVSCTLVPYLWKEKKNLFIDSVYVSSSNFSWLRGEDPGVISNLFTFCSVLVHSSSNWSKIDAVWLFGH